VRRWGTSRRKPDTPLNAGVCPRRVSPGRRVPWARGEQGRARKWEEQRDRSGNNFMGNGKVIGDQYEGAPLERLQDLERLTIKR